MPKKILGQIWLALCGLAFLVSCTPINQQEPVLLQGRTMGTTYNIKIVSALEFDKTALNSKIDQLLVDVNQAMSTYIDDSELSVFNKSKTSTGTAISPNLERVIKEAIRLGDLSQGKLDVTVGPLVNLWGFGPQQRPETIPTDSEIAEVRKQVGLDKLVLSSGMLTKKVPDLYVDLSTIAKGYGVDVVAELLEREGYNNYLVEIGGEMRLKGVKHSGDGWTVAIEKPVSFERQIYHLIEPKDNAVATSGDYRNYYESDGQRYSHIVDPDSGKPINHKLVSVTVIHPSSMTADGLSTALMVMGEKQAFEFAEQHQLAAYLIFKTEDGFDAKATSKFEPYLSKKRG